MKKMNMEKIFGGFCLSERKFVESLEKGAREFGGATKIDNIIFSNYNENPLFDIKDENIVGLIVPGTIDVDTVFDNKEIVEEIKSLAEYLYHKEVMTKDVEGAWVMEKNNEVVVENNVLMTWNSNCCQADMEFLKLMAEFVKKEMKQEAVSIVINEGLVII